jgi:hypothetical protein
MAITTDTALAEILNAYAASAAAETTLLKLANAADDKVEAEAPAPSIVIRRSRRLDGTITEHRAYSIEEIRNSWWFDRAQLDGWLAEFNAMKAVHEEAKVRHGAGEASNAWEAAGEVRASHFEALLGYRPADARTAVLWASAILAELGDGKPQDDKRDRALESLQQGLAAVAARSLG